MWWRAPPAAAAQVKHEMRRIPRDFNEKLMKRWGVLSSYVYWAAFCMKCCSANGCEVSHGRKRHSLRGSSIWNDVSEIGNIKKKFNHGNKTHRRWKRNRGSGAHNEAGIISLKPHQRNVVKYSFSIFSSRGPKASVSTRNRNQLISTRYIREMKRKRHGNDNVAVLNRNRALFVSLTRAVKSLTRCVTANLTGRW